MEEDGFCTCTLSFFSSVVVVVAVATVVVVGMLNIFCCAVLKMLVKAYFPAEFPSETSSGEGAFGGLAAITVDALLLLVSEGGVCCCCAEVTCASDFLKKLVSDAFLINPIAAFAILSPWEGAPCGESGFSVGCLVLGIVLGSSGIFGIGTCLSFEDGSFLTFLSLLDFGFGSKSSSVQHRWST